MNMMTWLTPRLTYLLGFIAVCALLGMAAYLQAHGVNPCPLCMLQRMTVALLGVMFFFGIVINPTSFASRLVALLSFLIALTGALLAGRQVGCNTTHLKMGPIAGLAWNI